MSVEVCRKAKKIVPPQVGKVKNERDFTNKSNTVLTSIKSKYGFLT